MSTENIGFIKVRMLTLEWKRGTLIAQDMVGLEYMLRRMCGYALEREKFGPPIAEFDAIKEKNANVRIWCEEEAAYEYVQLFGGYGYMHEYMVERFYRDAKLATIGAGTSEIQKGLIARAIMDLS